MRVCACVYVCVCVCARVRVFRVHVVGTARAEGRQGRSQCLLTRTACTPPRPLSHAPSHTHITPLPHSHSQPGFYKAGEFGIRIESDLLVVPAVTEYGAGAPAARQWLRFEYTTMVPIALNLLEPALMAEDELAWLDGYHASVREALLPRLALAAAGGDAEDGARARAWLEKATQPVHAPRK